MSNSYITITVTPATVHPSENNRATNSTFSSFLFAFIFANRKIAFLVFKKNKKKNTACVQPDTQAGLRETQRRGRENWMMMIRGYRSGCRSVEAAWGGSDTKTALVQTDKYVCPSVCFQWVFYIIKRGCLFRAGQNVSMMQRDADEHDYCVK